MKLFNRICIIIAVIIFAIITILEIVFLVNGVLLWINSDLYTAIKGELGIWLFMNLAYILASSFIFLIIKIKEEKENW